MNVFWAIKSHFTEHGLLYSVAIVCVLISGVVFLLSDAGTEQVSEVRSWPKVDATIVSSDLSEVNASNEISFSTRLVAKVRFRYEFNGNLHETDYVESWNRADSRDWSKILAPEAKLVVRVCPEREMLVSLLDHNGVP